MLNFHQSLPFLNWLFPLLQFPARFPTRFSHKIFLQDFPARFSHKNFPQDFPQEFPARFSHKIFPQDFPTRFSHKISFGPTRFSPRPKIFPKIFPQDFPPMPRFSQRLDWLAPHHPIPNAKFPPITAFLKLAFSPPHKISRKISHKIFPQDFPTRRFSHKISCTRISHFPTRFSHKNFPKIFPQDFPFPLQDFPKLDPDWLAPHHPIPNAKFPPITAFLKLAFSPPPPQDFPTRISHKIFPQDFPARFSHRFPKDFPTRFSHKIFPQDFPARFSRAGS